MARPVITSSVDRPSSTLEVDGITLTPLPATAVAVTGSLEIVADKAAEASGSAAVTTEWLATADKLTASDAELQVGSAFDVADTEKAAAAAAEVAVTSDFDVADTEKAAETSAALDLTTILAARVQFSGWELVDESGDQIVDESGDSFLITELTY